MDKIKLQHQKDLNGCGIACLSNLLNKPYDQVRNDFEGKFYTIERGSELFKVKSLELVQAKPLKNSYLLLEYKVNN